MTTKKPKPLTILGAPLRKSRYGWIAKTKLGVVKVFVWSKSLGDKVYACASLTAVTFTSLRAVPAPLNQRACDRISSQLRAVHRACQVKL